VLTIFVVTLGSASLTARCGSASPGDRFDNHRTGRFTAATRSPQYSELAQINAGNVERLGIAWEYHHGDPDGPSMSSNPIVVDGLLYFTTPKVNAVALDAATGREAWVFEAAKHRRAGGISRTQPRGGLLGRRDRRGRPDLPLQEGPGVRARRPHRRGDPSFGEGGFIDLRKHLPVDPERASIEVTTPGIVYRDVLIVGSGVPEGNDSTPGDIRAYDARTGASAEMKSPEFLLRPTLLEKATKLGWKTALVSSKDKIRSLCSRGAAIAASAGRAAVPRHRRQTGKHFGRVNFWSFRLARHLLK
jgi:quinoprotein glucose dehydrogenase